MEPKTLFLSAEIDPKTKWVSSMTFQVHYEGCSADVHIRLSPPLAADGYVLVAARRELDRLGQALVRTATHHELLIPGVSLSM